MENRGTAKRLWGGAVLVNLTKATSSSSSMINSRAGFTLLLKSAQFMLSALPVVVNK